VKHSGSLIPFLSNIFLAGQQILEKEKKLLDAFLKTKQKSLFEIYFWHKLFRKLTTMSYISVNL